MTEQQLRQKVADIISAWLGAAKGSATHLEILRIYNTHTPLARGYKVQPGDAYCATTVSATWISAGIAEYTGTECGCDKFIEIARNKGIWVEDDSYVPKIGDACLYDWDDSGAGDNRGSADHIGIVVRSGGGTFDVVEGNGSGGRVVKRTMNVNGRYIRGFICPDYKTIAEGEDMTKEETTKLINQTVAPIGALLEKIEAEILELRGMLGPMIKEYKDVPWKTVKPNVRWMLDNGVIDGGTDYEKNPDDIGLPLQLLRVLICADRDAAKRTEDLEKRMPCYDE